MSRSDQQRFTDAQLQLYYRSNAPSGVLPDGPMQGPGYYPPQRQGLTFQTPRSWWFYICIIFLIGLFLIALAAGILGIIFGTVGIVAPATQAPIEGANVGAAPFAAPRGNPTAPHSSRYDALILTGSLSALVNSISNVTGVGTALAIEQGGIEVYNGGLYTRDRIVSDTGIGYPSDRRIKKNIEPVDSRESYDIVNRLKPVYFNYMKHWAIHRDSDGNPLPSTPGLTRDALGQEKDDSKGVRQKGFIAQDVKPVVPNAVDTISRTLAPDDTNPAVPRQLDDFHVIDMAAIIPDLVGALQHMSKEMRQLTEQNKELRAQLEQFKQAAATAA